MTRSLSSSKFAALRSQLSCLQKKVEEVGQTFDELELAANRLEERLKQRARTLQRGSYLLHMMELFLRRPMLAALLTRCVSHFFQLLLAHVEAEAPEGVGQSPLSCIRQLWARERRSRELRRCRHRFCQQRRLSSELLAVLTEIHDVFAEHSLPEGELFLHSDMREKENVESLLAQIDEEVGDPTVATAFKQTVLAVACSGDAAIVRKFECKEDSLMVDSQVQSSNVL